MNHPHQRPRRLALAISLAVAASPPAAAITVTQPTDEHVSGRCSLREAVQSASTWTAPADTDCEAGTPGNSVVSIPYARIELVHGSLEPGGTVRIDGAAPNGGRTVITRAEGAPAFSIIHRTTSTVGSDTTLSRLEITGGSAFIGGGGIHSQGRLVLIDCVVSGNSTLGNGGGIYADQADRVRLVNSTVSGNTAGGVGGGIATTTRLSLEGSTISDNSAEGHGGGIYSNALAIHVSNSTISGNATHGSSPNSGNGGGIFFATVYAHGQVTNSTIARNTTSGNGSGAGIYLVSGESPLGDRLTLVSSLLSRNVSGKYEENIAAGAAITVAGSRDLIGPASAEITPPIDALDCDPQIGLLHANGGPTQTIAIAATSCVIDQGIDNELETDQRGSGYPRNIGVRADIGAFEYDPDRIFANGFDG